MDANWGNPFNPAAVHPQDLGDMNFYVNMIQGSSSQAPPAVHHPASHAAVQGVNPAVEPPPKQTRRNFSIPEDEILVSCWLNASLDPITANGQRKGSFWKTVERNYNVQKGDGFPHRSLRSLDGRWRDIKDQVSKFESHYQHVLNEKRSGEGDDDRISEAVTRYNSIEGGTFTMMHCWKVLRNQPKWTDLTTPELTGATSGDPVDLSDSGPTQVDSYSVSGTKRPAGRDTSKAAKKASSSRSDSASVGEEFTSLLSNMHVEKMTTFTRSDDAVADKLTKLIEMEEKKVALGNRKQDQKIMAMDLTMCNPAQRAVYAAWQAEIAARVLAKPPNPTDAP